MRLVAIGGLICTLCAVVASFSTGGTQKQVLSTTDLHQLSGGQEARWCWKIADCDGNNIAVCIDDLQCSNCAGKAVGARCRVMLPQPQKYFFPEVCNLGLGNETCSGNPPQVEVECYELYKCFCKLDIGDPNDPNDDAICCVDTQFDKDVCKTEPADSLVCRFTRCHQGGGNYGGQLAQASPRTRTQPVIAMISK